MTSSHIYIDQSLLLCDQLMAASQRIGIDLNSIEERVAAEVQSLSTIQDMGFCLLFGIIGGLFSSSSQVKSFLADIHDNASKSSSNNFLLKHVGDGIDKYGDSPHFTDRNMSERIPSFNGISPHVHRILFGHDPFSMKSDNPFFVLAKQHGPIKGILQALRHLLGDTFSKQGLPLPFHSFLDYKDSAGTLQNRLADLCNGLSGNKRLPTGGEYRVFPSEACRHIFSINAQDLMAQGLTWALTSIYIRLNEITDKSHQCQLKLTAYTTCFATNVISGYIKMGIPYINWPCLAMCIKELAGLFMTSYAQIRALERKTDLLIAEGNQLEQKVFATGSDMVSYETGAQYLNELDGQFAHFSKCMDRFAE